MAPHQIALITDMPYLRPTLVAMMSAIKHTPGPVHVHVLGDGLTASATDAIKSACDKFSNATLLYHDVSDDLPTAMPEMHHPNVMWAKTMLPRYISGRVLYLDSDIVVKGDLRPLLEIDLDGQLIAAAREHWIIARIKDNPEFPRTSPLCKIMDPFDAVDNFNTGVMLMDCDKIKNHSDFKNGFIGNDYMVNYKDYENLNNAYDLNDQYIYNLVFKGNVAFIGPEWNCSWGRLLKTRWVQRKVLRPEQIQPYQRTKIIHFSGKKPWKLTKVSRDSAPLPHFSHPWWLKHGVHVVSYRLLEKQLLRSLNVM